MNSELVRRFWLYVLNMFWLIIRAKYKILFSLKPFLIIKIFVCFFIQLFSFVSISLYSILDSITTGHFNKIVLYSITHIGYFIGNFCYLKRYLCICVTMFFQFFSFLKS